MAEPHPEVIDPQHPLVKRVRQLCLEYPEATEEIAWGRPSFRAGQRIFVLMSAGMDRPHSIVIKPAPDARDAYLADERFFVPKYWGAKGWLGIDVDRPDTDWKEIAELIDESYRQVALVRQLKALDKSTPKTLV